MKYRIAPDANSWNIEMLRVAGENSKAVAPGTETWTAIKYYATLQQAAMGLQELVGREQAAQTTIDTSAILAAVSAATGEVKRAVAELKEKTHV